MSEYSNAAILNLCFLLTGLLTERPRPQEGNHDSVFLFDIFSNIIFFMYKEKYYMENNRNKV